MRKPERTGQAEMGSPRLRQRPGAAPARSEAAADPFGEGDVALVEARPDSHKEVARFKVFEGKTWNHPVIAHGKLFVRNGEEAACYQLVEERSR